MFGILGIMGAFGGLFGLCFLAVLALIAFAIVQSVLRAQQVDALRRGGTRVAATVTNVLHERVQTNPGMAPNAATGMPATAPIYRDDWFVEAAWTNPQTGAAYRFKSDRLTHADALRYTAGQPITVLIDPNDPTRHYVEIAR